MVEELVVQEDDPVERVVRLSGSVDGGDGGIVSRRVPDVALSEILLDGALDEIDFAGFFRCQNGIQAVLRRVKFRVDGQLLLFPSGQAIARLTLASGLSNPSCTRVLFSQPKLPNSALARFASAPTLFALSRRILSRRFFCTGGVDDRGGRSTADSKPDATDEEDGTAEVELRR